MNDIVKLSEGTVETLKRMFSVHQELRIIEGDKVLRVKSANGTMVCHAEIEEEFPRDVNIYDLREFIAVVGILNDPELDLSNDKWIAVRSSDGTQQLRYMEANPEFITSFSARDIVLPSTDVDMVITEAQMKQVHSAAQTMKLDFIGFVGDGEKVYLSAFKINNGDGKETNNFKIEVGETTETFKMYYKLEHSDLGVLLGEGDLHFQISFKKISYIETVSGKKFWIALDAKSES